VIMLATQIQYFQSVSLIHFVNWTEEKYKQ